MKQVTINGHLTIFTVVGDNNDGGTVVQTVVTAGGGVFRHWYSIDDRAQAIYDAIDTPAGEADALYRVNRAIALG